ncbi:hypothetical protein F2Q70_00036653 [Brassica cretica]|uniref:Uncharacterized protein n=1 Tax=Brassica cretica TaxID=69181 RepID=A0A8S9JX42_BRACR|nr:hypothetical protein F2Q70_00036653 [Brassica cretica]
MSLFEPSTKQHSFSSEFIVLRLLAGIFSGIFLLLVFQQLLSPFQRERLGRNASLRTYRAVHATKPSGQNRGRGRNIEKTGEVIQRRKTTAMGEVRGGDKRLNPKRY